MVRNQHWLVTGAAGFLGSHVVKELLARSERVTALDDLSTGRRDYLPQEEDGTFEFAKLDMRRAGDVADLFERCKPDVVVHLAALHFIPAAMADPPLAVSLNVHGTQSILSACRRSGVQRVWVASTGDVYVPSDGALKETDRIGPFNIYGLTKLMGEQLVGLESSISPSCCFVIGRLFNLYGPHETNPHILPEIIDQLRAKPGTPLSLGSVWPKRDMVPIADAAHAIIESSLKAAPGVTILNIATGVAVSMEEIIATIGELLGTKIEIQTDPAKVRAVERPHLQADVSKLRALLGWAPSSDLRARLTELLRFEGLLS